MPLFKNLKEFNLPKLEEKVLFNWEKNHIFEESLKQRAGRPIFRFYEGPPYANGLPGIHHVLSRVFKDIVLRYKAMRGYRVPRRAGWDTHGLPIEIAAEKELGIKTKNEIEKIGIEVFNRKAREIVWRYRNEWERFTERIGYWLDLKDAYVTYDSSYIESLWWVFKKISDRGYLKEFRKVLPYCPRCETPLSSHEMGMPGVYNLTEDPSLYLKFPLKDSDNEYLLVWTTTPWTLPANVAVAVDAGLTYTKYKVGKEFLWSFSPPPKLPPKAEAVEKLSGRQLVGRHYKPLYLTKDYKPRTSDFRVVAAPYVKTDEGTGLVHVSPAFGEEDFELIGRDDFPVTVNDQGIVNQGLPGSGKFIKKADKEIANDLKKRGLVYLDAKVEHEYPFCWRCLTPIIYFARKSWFLEVSRLRKQLVAENKKINWIPSYIREGRFGEWIKNAVDWSVSRERYWGTPLPIWRCQNGHLKVIGKIDELDRFDYQRNEFFILRHGMADHNLSGLFASGPETGDKISFLTEEGKKQAETIARRLKWKRIDLIFTSPYKRALETAEIVARRTGTKVIIDDRLREINAGEFSWRAIARYQAFFKDPFEKFTKTPKGGESWLEVKQRVFDFIRDVNKRYQNKKILIVSHKAPLEMLEAAVRELTDEEVTNLPKIDVGEWREIKLRNLPYSKEGQIDLHRPYVDEIYLRCSKCQEKMERVPDVADVWFDSGAMPLASVHYPFENKKDIDRGILYPADFIAEAVDQTRGWFYTLLAEAVLLGKKSPYRNVISLGLIHDKYGQKMSKSKGNIVDPQEVINKYGVDAVRWYFYTINPPGEPKDFDEAEIQLTTRRLFLILYNSFNFYEMMRKNFKLKTGSANASPSGRHRHVLDSWILARLNETIRDATESLEQYEIGVAARLIESLVDDLSRWYIRRSRRRPEAQETLGFVLLQISKLIAPFAPFFGETLYTSTAASGGFKSLPSVHLEDWPKMDQGLIDEKILQQMKKIRELAALALAERSVRSIKVRQPLPALRLGTKYQDLKGETALLEILRNEINVKEILFDDGIQTEIKLDLKITQALKEEGITRELIRLIQNLRREVGLEPRNKIYLSIQTTPTLKATLNRWLKLLKDEVNAKEVEFRASRKFDAELATKIDSENIRITVKKV